jgi:hypothetical protein
VGPLCGRIFAYQTTVMLEQLLRKQYRLAPAYQPGVSGATGLGYPVPLIDVFDLREPEWPFERWWERFDVSQLTSRKGAHAVDVVTHILDDGRFPLWGANGENSNDFDIQVSGTDMIVVGKWRIQVKCDYKAGPRPKGTGNLYVQVAERNPLKRF